MKSIIRIIVVSPVRTGKSKVAGNPDWAMQDAQCILINDDGVLGEVGALTLPRDLTGIKADGHPKVAPGDYIGAFAMQVDRRDGGRLKAVLTGLQPYAAPRSTPAAPAPAAIGAHKA